MIENLSPLNLSVIVFAMYLLVASNYVAELFSCRLRTLLSQNMWAKHIVAFFLLLFLVVVVNPEYSSKQPVLVFAMSICVYIWFFVTCRTNFMVTLLILLFLMMAYVTSLFKSQYKLRAEETKDNKDPKLESNIKLANLLQSIFAYVALGLSVIGFVLYFVEKKLEYKNKFTISKFIVGETKCKNFTPNNVRILR